MSKRRRPADGVKMIIVDTIESFEVGGFDLPPSKCLFCCKDTTSTAGWIGVRCHNCNNIFSGEEWMGNIAKRRREMLGYTLPHFAEIVNRSKHTIKKYEYVKCPDWYFKKTEELMKNTEAK